MSAGLSRLDQLHLSTVLEDCADQLAILGHVMPDNYRGLPAADMVSSGGKLEASHQNQDSSLQNLHRFQKELNCALEDNPLSPDNLAKVQRDRQFVAQVITSVLEEVKKKGTFHGLLQVVEDEKKKKAGLLDIIISEEESRKRTEALQKELVCIRREKTLDLQRQDEMTAHLKDQLKDLRAKSQIQRKYVKSSAELLIHQTSKLNSLSETRLADENRLLHKTLEEKTRNHERTETFLKNQQTLLEEKLEMWMERYEKDMEDKQQEVNSLKINKADNLFHLQELAKKYREMEQVVIEDRIQKENLRKQVEREQAEKGAAIKIQAWWRGMLVRRGLGPFKKGKKASSKGKKKGKKKK